MSVADLHMPRNARCLRWREIALPAQAVHAAEIVGPETDETGHTHDFMEVWWVLAGRGTERIGSPGAAFRDEPIESGAYGIVMPTDHHAMCDRGALRFRNIAFPVADWSALHRRYSLPNLFSGEIGARRGRLTWAAAERLTRESAPLLSGRCGPADRDRFLLVLIDVFATALSATPSATPSAPMDPPPDWLRAALAVPERWRDGVAAFVAVCGYSREHVARTCRNTLNRTPTQIVDAARVDRAAELLSTTLMPVAEVGTASGFLHLPHFHARFRHRFGVTPAAFRRRHRAIAPGPAMRSPPDATR